MFYRITHQPFVWRVKCGVSEVLMVAVARLSSKQPTPQDQGSITALTLRRVPENLAVARPGWLIHHAPRSGLLHLHTFNQIQDLGCLRPQRTRAQIHSARSISMYKRREFLLDTQDDSDETLVVGTGALPNPPGRCWIYRCWTYRC
jgi:hypothetical protein